LSRENKKSLFIVCDDDTMTWALVPAESVEDAIAISRKNGYDPYFVVDVKQGQVTEVWDEEMMAKHLLKNKRGASE